MLTTVSRSFPACLALTLCCICMTPARTAAWGSSGHRIIASIAFQNLNPRARQEVEKLLGKEDFVAISTYADEVRPKRPETTRWHYIDFPREATAYVSSRDCIETPLGDCTVAAIQRLVGVLRTEKAGRDEKAEALKFLVHLVGDLHQPLHAGYRDDAGGNTIKVWFFSESTSLHSVWDYSMIEQAEGVKQKGDESAAEENYINYLVASYHKLALETHANVVKGKGYPEEWAPDWAFESYCVAVRNAYNLDLNKNVSNACAAPGAKIRPEDKKVASLAHISLSEAQSKSSGKMARKVAHLVISTSYYKENLPVMEQQLVKAGVRLAEILNYIYPDR
ncbi:MAG TPA: S1/P1 nuclease [Pyrinomonadaceae bacterium]|nr:S1/P1 nuclease [Pyrinomonadaceae bacterium]